MHTFELTITALDNVLFHGEAVSVTCPGIDGELTVLKDHEALITTLKEGIITVRTGEEKSQTFPVASEKGVLEVSKKGVTILL